MAMEWEERVWSAFASDHDPKMLCGYHKLARCTGRLPLYDR